MTDDYASRITTHPPTSKLWRMRRSMFGQADASPICPMEPRLDGRVALVTGGGRGIGLETSRGLLARGAETIAASRGREGGDGFVRAMKSGLGTPAHFVPLDLSDLDSIEPALDALVDILGDRKLDVLIANAGLWPQRYATSAQGLEIAYATNVLGHHALIRGGQRRDLFAPGARVVLLTGDIYVLANACTKDHRWQGPLGGQMAYCRSKLGNLWQGRELARRHPELAVRIVHPGVIASGLGGSGAAFSAMKRLILLSPERGAQTSLFCATQPGLSSGAYHHNVLGRMDLSPRDPAADDARASEFFDELDRLVEG